MLCSVVRISASVTHTQMCAEVLSKKHGQGGYGWRMDEERVRECAMSSEGVG